jgi:hypothetical protein
MKLEVDNNINTWQLVKEARATVVNANFSQFFLA